MRSDKRQSDSQNEVTTQKRKTRFHARCNICSRQFRRKDLKDYHVEHHEEMVYKCLDPCTWMFERRVEIYRHLGQVHDTKLSRENQHLYMIKPSRSSRSDHVRKHRKPSSAESLPNKSSTSNEKESNSKKSANTTECQPSTRIDSSSHQNSFPDRDEIDGQDQDEQTQELNGTDAQQQKSPARGIEIGEKGKGAAEETTADDETTSREQQHKSPTTDVKMGEKEKGKDAAEETIVDPETTGHQLADVDEEERSNDVETNRPNYTEALRRGYETYHTLLSMGAIKKPSREGAAMVTFRLPDWIFHAVQTKRDHSYSATNNGLNPDPFTGYTGDEKDVDHYSNSDLDETWDAEDEAADEIDGDQHEKEYKRVAHNERNEFADDDFSIELPDEIDHGFRDEFDEPYSEQMGDVSNEELNDGSRENDNDVDMGQTNEEALSEEPPLPEIGNMDVPKRSSILINITSESESESDNKVTFEPRDGWDKKSSGGEEDREDNLVLRLEESEGDGKAKETGDVSDAEPRYCARTKAFRVKSSTSAQKTDNAPSAAGAGESSPTPMTIFSASSPRENGTMVSSTVPSPTAGPTTPIPILQTGTKSKPQNSFTEDNPERHIRFSSGSNNDPVTTENADEQCCLVALVDTFKHLSQEGVLVAKQEILRVLCNVEFYKSTPSTQMFSVRPLSEPEEANIIEEGKKTKGDVNN